MPKKLDDAGCVETEPVVSLVITVSGDGSLHNVGMAPDDHAEILTHERIARLLCSVQDQLTALSAGGPVTANCDTEAPGPPMNPTLAASSANLHIILLHAPFLRSQKLVLEINLAPKRCNKLVLVLLLLHPNYVKARDPQL
jgi:hypothetical protein